MQVRYLAALRPDGSHYIPWEVHLAPGIPAPAAKSPPKLAIPGPSRYNYGHIPAEAPFLVRIRIESFTDVALGPTVSPPRQGTGRPESGAGQAKTGRLLMGGPLAGVKVLDFTEVIAGPLAGRLLAEMGAEVIKIEPPWGDPWRTTQPFMPQESRSFITYNRGKRSLPLDLTKPEAQEVLGRLASETDVVLVNYRPDVAVKLGVDYDTLAQVNPRLIYCEMTAYGRQGPDAHRPGYDMILQAMTGMMAAENKTIDGIPQWVWSSPVIDTTSGMCMPGACARLCSPGSKRAGAKNRDLSLGVGSILDGVPIAPGGGPGPRSSRGGAEGNHRRTRRPGSLRRAGGDLAGQPPLALPRERLLPGVRHQGRPHCRRLSQRPFAPPVVGWPWASRTSIWNPVTTPIPPRPRSTLIRY